MKLYVTFTLGNIFLMMRVVMKPDMQCAHTVT